MKAFRHTIMDCLPTRNKNKCFYPFPLSYRKSSSGNPLKLFRKGAIALILLLIIGGCAETKFDIKNIAKTDIDMIAEIHLNEINTQLKTLMVKLYKRNPRELKKQPGQTIKNRIKQLFAPSASMAFAELNNKQSIDAMLLCFDPDYKGDRVFALMTGLTGMIRSSYNNQDEFYLIDFLDPQKLYNSARNIEILVWRLSNKKNNNNELFLLTNGLKETDINLSFERLFGKLISIQDMMAKIIGDTTKRTINTMVKTVATASFIPIGI